MTITGTVDPVPAGAGVTVTLSGAANASTITDASGKFSFSGLSNGSFSVAASSASATFAPSSRQVSLDKADVTSVNFSATPSPNARTIFFDDFSGGSLGPAWTVVQRRGPAEQSENACNTPDAVRVADGLLTITTSATPATCGDSVTAPTQLPYTSGDIQWANLNFTYGTVEVRAKLPSQDSGTWPAIWLHGSNCQSTNAANGSTSVAFNGCPAQGDPSYREIDMVECDTRGWCHLVVAQGRSGWSSMCSFPVDANWHVFSLTWNASTVAVSVDGKPTGCSYPNTSLHGPMFLIIQTQTTTSAGVAGLPNNSQLPTTLQVDYVKVTQP